MSADQVKARSRSCVIINAFDNTDADDAFTQLAPDPNLEWIRLSGLPANWLERHVRGIRVSRYRAAIQAAIAAKPGRCLITHLPLMTAAAASAMALMRRRIPHLAFAFNFTILPSGRRLHYLHNCLGNVEQFAVFSQFEQNLYAGAFGIDPARIKPVIWTQGVPPVQAKRIIEINRPYLCAIGGEGRDFRLLVDTARRLGPKVPMVLVVRPESLTGLSVPDHVQVLTNIPLDQVWRIAVDSHGVLIPLTHEDTCCGHITLVSSKLLGIPLALTKTHATREYVDGRAAILQCDPGDVKAYTDLAGRLIDEATTLRATAQADKVNEKKLHDRRIWAEYLDQFLNDNHCLD